MINHLSRRDYTSRQPRPLVPGGHGVYIFYKWVTNNIQPPSGLGSKFAFKIYSDSTPSGLLEVLLLSP